MKKVFYLLSAVAITLGMTMPQEANARSNENDLVIAQDVNYQEIPKENVPATVTESLGKDYSGYMIDKAYLGDDGSYKLDVSHGDVKYTLYYKENGELIKVEEPAGEKIEEGIQEGKQDVEEGVKDLQEGVKDTVPEMK
ncbi:MAG: hypothetical protein ABFD10_12860 [Prolixibacteraceae bacterium]